MRNGDVYRFSYTDTSGMHMPYHCFDGQLVAFEQSDGSFLLRDTYWLHDFKERSDTRTFTEADAKAEGELVFVCNLNDVQKIKKHDADYYDDGDLFNISYQHGCYPCMALRKGAAKSPEKMLRVIEQRTAEARRNIESAQREIERLGEYAKKVEAGDLSEVWL